MVKVPGFFASKKSGTATKKTSTAKKPPVVVVHTGKTLLEIIKHEKGNLEASEGKNTEPDFQGLYQQESRLSNEEGIIKDVMLQQTESTAKKVSAEPFEEVLGKIDKGIKKYNSKASISSGFGTSIGEENDGDHSSINESNVPSPQAHAALLSASSRVPLVENPNSLVNHVHAKGTWKRLTRVGPVSDVVSQKDQKKRKKIYTGI
ncbi:hypothetical protein CMV_016798 [Castanea mollissima]|uniref:Uncharacterized protein n=1 Tax=Castanea mollissima TaxID=60419 RepID=A0A8J4QS12_9ROSI|nr:hypothetical protein CMV_016798 [Castanea mollissima]